MLLLRGCCAALVCLLATVGTLAHDDHAPPPRVADAAAHQPSAIPDRIVLTWASNPATSMAVSWRTDTSVRRAFGEVQPADHGPLLANPARRVAAATARLDTNLGQAHYHSAHFDQLQPKTKYAYRVGDGNNWSEWSQFVTASDQAEPFTFVYFGDAQNELKSQWSRVIREAYSDAPKAAFLLHAGDLVNRANNDAEWGDWFYSSSHIHRMIPCLPTPGNHEYHRVGLQPTLTAHWRSTFALPAHGPPGLEETVYWIDYQGTRFISLNSNERLEDQVDWVAGVLSDHAARWTIVTFHHPIHSASAGRDNPRLRNLWQPVFDRFRVDLVLQGHDHTYARSGLMAYENVATGATSRSESAGTVYVVSVSGPKMYRVDRRPHMRRVAENTQLYQIITVRDDELLYEARTAVGTVYDAFTLRKRPGQVNELIERGPDSPERRAGGPAEP